MESPNQLLSVILIIFVINCLSCQPFKFVDTHIDMYSNYEKDLMKFIEFESLNGHSLQTSNAEIHFYTIGDLNEPTILWLHGTFGSSYDFIEASARFLEEGYSSIAIDYYGHGQTNRPLQDVSIYDMADDIIEVLSSLDVSMVTVIGISRGGTIASALYDEYSDYINCLVLVDGGSVQWTYQVQKIGEVESRKRIGSFQVPTSNTYPDRESAYNSYRDSTSHSNWKIFNSLQNLQVNDTLVWSLNYNLAKWLWESNLDEIMDGAFRPNQIPLFEASNVLLNPRIVYRNLSVPMLIIDPITKGDWIMDYTEENSKLASLHRDYVKHVIYNNTNHNILAQKPQILLDDILYFLSKIVKN